MELYTETTTKVKDFKKECFGLQVYYGCFVLQDPHEGPCSEMLNAQDQNPASSSKLVSMLAGLT